MLNELKDSWFNSSFSIGSSLTGSTLFTGVNFIEQLTGDINPITIIGWVITTSWGLMASISRWKLNNAETERELSEARKNNAEAQKIENAIDNEAKACEIDACHYKEFYENFHPIMIHHFSEMEKTSNTNID